MDLDTLDKQIINRLQDGFPVSSRPYAEAAEQFGISEDELLERLECLLNERYLSRFGPMYHAEQLGGGLTLAALAVPEGRFDEVNEIVNGFDEVAHNYQRTHELNMWFVLATETPEGVAETIKRIEAATDLHVYNMPKQEEFYVGLKFEL